MIARQFACCNLRRHINRHVYSTKIPRRKLSSTPSSSAQAPAASPFAGLTTELDRIAPHFDIDASQVSVLDSPSSFYDTLKTKILSARQRIYLSTLYIGKTEHELIATLHQALYNNPALKVSILTDALRGTRETPDPSCASLLADLVAQHGSDRVEIRMFHTPNLTGLRKRVIPRRINEGWGLQHMKLYGFDDEIMLSGANLSNDYFTNRLDRYHVFSSKRLSDFYEQIHNAVCCISFRVLPDAHNAAGYLLDWPSANDCPSPLEDPNGFRRHSRKLLEPLYLPATSTSQSIQRRSLEPASGTHIYPLAQFTPLYKDSNADLSTEYPALVKLLTSLCSFSSPFTWTFTAGYFNVHPRLRSLLVKSAFSKNNTVLTASPWANGFFGSAGVSGMLPDAYTHLSRRFLDRVHASGKQDNITLKEWRKGTVGQPGGWTYHAKGLWVTFPPTNRGGETSGPSVTVVGSSNYTKRSYSLDLEIGALVVTEDEELKKKLQAEVEGLQRDAAPISREELRSGGRRVSWKVRTAMWIVSVVGGAL